MSALELKNITKVYGEKVKTKVLNNTDLTINEGEFVSIIGQSGSGKSTLQNIMGTLSKGSSGTLYINGINVEGMNKNELADLRNSELGFIFQFHYLLPEFTVIENI